MRRPTASRTPLCSPACCARGAQSTSTHTTLAGWTVSTRPVQPAGSTAVSPATQRRDEPSALVRKRTPATRGRG